MPFPEKTLLTRPVRRGIMVCLILSFFMIAPLVVLYTMGYRFDFATRSLRTTGVLNIDTEPTDATVTLNGTVLRDRMPIKLFNRAPGTYAVEISADGYHTWGKDIRIESNQTTYIKGLTLFLHAQPREITQTHTTTRIFFSPNGVSRIVTVPSNDETSNQYTSIYQDIGAESYLLATTTPSSTVTVTWAENGADFGIEIQEEKHKRLLTGTAESSVVSKELVLDIATPLHYQWTNTLLGGASLFVGTSTLSTRINNNTITTLNHPSTTPIWHTDNGTNIWTYASSTKTISYNDEALFTNIETGDILFATEQTALLKQGDQHAFVAKNQDSAQHSITLPGPYSLYIPQTREWVLYSPYEITILYADGTYNAIYRTDEPIMSVLTLEDTGVILIAKKNQLIGFNPGFYTSQPLLQTEHIESVGVDQDTRTIYFYGTHGGVRGLHSLQY